MIKEKKKTKFPLKKKKEPLTKETLLTFPIWWKSRLRNALNKYEAKFKEKNSTKNFYGNAEMHEQYCLGCHSVGNVNF